jgi:hypothetical protein
VDVTDATDPAQVNGLAEGATPSDFSPEEPATAGEQPSSAAQLEPVDSTPEDDEPVAAAEPETSPASEEAPTTDDGDAHHEVAS